MRDMVTRGKDFFFLGGKNFAKDWPCSHSGSGGNFVIKAEHKRLLTNIVVV